MTPFVDKTVGTADDIRTDPYVWLEKLTEDLALRLLRTFAPDAPDDAYHIVGSGATRITAGELRRLNQACMRARRLRI